MEQAYINTANDQLRNLMLDHDLSAADVVDIINRQAGSEEVTIWSVYAWRKNFSGQRRMRDLYLKLLKAGLRKKRPLKPR